ncbi:MAG: phosphatidylinositol-specific phospholipase C/glycerophosphodiester phosphodiesterase family protein [Tannerella sp.]|jgi:alkaline phosphatase|nr:phosphatidylinositol-specific phospholipase C/glycerophosphodiester phosphodiesterase family protein [Tannerella sp.]
MNHLKSIRMIFPAVMIVFCAATAPAQEVRIHSHNDYRRSSPFHHALSHRAASVEADIYATATDGELLVAHDRDELPSAPTLDETYLQPLIRLFRQNNGRVRNDSNRPLVLLIDLKTPVHPTLERLIAKLRLYPDVFDPTVNPHAVRVVISGNRPDADTFGDYPPFIFFDGERTDYTPEQLKRIYMISLNLRNYTQWNGKGRMTEGDLRQVLRKVGEAHTLGKPVRFWGTPDGPTAWRTFHSLGVDYINTDHPEACAAFFNPTKRVEH